MRRKRLGLLLAVLAIAGIATALSVNVGNAGQDKAAKAAKSYKIYLIPKFIGIPVFTENGKGAKEAGKKLGDKVTYNGPTDATPTSQVSFIDAAARQGFNAIIISANDPNAVVPALNRAKQRGAKVVSYDADAAKSARSIYVSPPSARDIGFAQVEWLGSQIGYRGQFAIVSATTTAANQNAWIKWI